MTNLANAVALVVWPLVLGYAVYRWATDAWTAPPVYRR